MQKNKYAYFSIAVVYLIALLLYLMPSDWAFSISRIWRGNTITWRQDTLVLPDGHSMWYVTKANQLQINYLTHGTRWLAFDSISDPVRHIKDFADHFCASKGCADRSEFSTQLGKHDAECTKFLDSEAGSGNITFILCGIDDISVRAEYVGPAVYAETAAEDMKSLLSQMH